MRPFKKPVKKYADGELVTKDKKLTTGSKGVSTTTMRSEKPTMVENKAPSAMQLSKIGAENETTSAKPTMKSAPVAKPTMKSAPTSKYRGGRSEDDINRMIAEATPDRMKTAQPEIDRMAASARAEKLREDNPGMKRGGAVKKAYKSGGMVKSGASRGDGIAQRGRTKGKYC